MASPPDPTPSPQPGAHQRRWWVALALVLALVGGLSVGGVIDQGLRLVDDPLLTLSEARVDDALIQGFAVYAGARAINAVVSVLQTGEINAGLGVGGSLAIGEILDPLNDLIERFSVVLMICLMSLGIQKMALLTGADVALPFLVGPGLLVLALALGLRPASGMRRRLLGAGRWLVLVGLMARLGLPLALLAGDAIAQRLVTPLVSTSTSQIERLSDTATDFENTGVTDFAERVEQLQDTARQVIAAVVDVMYAFLFQVILLPLVLLVVMAKLIGISLGPLTHPLGPGRPSSRTPSPEARLG